MVQTIEKKSYQRQSDWDNRLVTYTPVFWIDAKGKERFVRNRVSGSGDASREREDEEKIERMLSILEASGFRYMPHYLNNWFTNFPVEDAEAFLQWKKKNGYTFKEVMTEKVKDADGSVHFNGNLNECSAAFWFVVYDRKLIRQWDEAFAEDGISTDTKKHK